MNILEAARSLGVTPKKAGPKEYASACPMCGGADRFRLWPTEGKNGAGRFWCRRCDKKGDVVQLFMDAKGLDFKSAARLAGRELRPRAKKYVKKRQTKKQEFEPRDYGAPKERWQACAAAFMEYAVDELEKRGEKQKYLAERGIPYETARKYRLGYNPKDIYTSRAKWGLPEKVNGKKKKLFIPAGLVIPAFYMDGKPRLHPYRLRIRRDDPGKFPRYHMMEGSNPQTCAMAPQGLNPGFAWVVVEAELDALAIAAACGDYVGGLGLGSVAMKPPAEAMTHLKDAGVILNALDYDAAGAKAHAWWVKNFPQTERWPVPEGKDPGEFFAAGGDIGLWIEKGLPPACRRDFLIPAVPESVSVPVKDDIYDAYFKHCLTHYSPQADDINNVSLGDWTKEHVPELYKEEARRFKAINAYWGGDYKKFKAAVLAYFNHINTMADAYRAVRDNRKAEQAELALNESHGPLQLG